MGRREMTRMRKSKEGAEESKDWRAYMSWLWVEVEIS
jgi:hypothetical protein